MKTDLRSRKQDCYIIKVLPEKRIIISDFLFTSIKFTKKLVFLESMVKFNDIVA